MQKVFTRIFYGTIGVAASFALALLFYWGLLLNSSIAQLVNNTKDQPFYIWPYVGLTCGAIVFFGVNASFIVYRWRRYGPPQLQAQTGTGGGALIGVAASVCPVCGSFLLSAVGVTGGLAAFPFGGLELKAASAALLIFPIWFMWRDMKRGACTKNGVCPVPRDASFRASSRPWLILAVAVIISEGIIGWSMLRSDPVSAAFFSDAQNSHARAGAGFCEQTTSPF